MNENFTKYNVGINKRTLLTNKFKCKIEVKNKKNSFMTTYKYDNF